MQLFTDIGCRSEGARSWTPPSGIRNSNAAEARPAGRAAWPVTLRKPLLGTLFARECNHTRSDTTMY